MTMANDQYRKLGRVDMKRETEGGLRLLKTKVEAGGWRYTLRVSKADILPA